MVAAVPLTGEAPEVSTARTSMSNVLPSVAVVMLVEVAVAGVMSDHPPLAGQDADDALCRDWYLDAVPVAGAVHVRSTWPAVHAAAAVRDCGAEGADWARVSGAERA